MRIVGGSHTDQGLRWLLNVAVDGTRFSWYERTPSGISMGAILMLEDGRTFTGDAFGATTRVGEIVFNTAMTGYPEVLTDPSHAEQVMT